MNSKTNYLSQLLKKGYLLIALLLTSVALTCLVGIYEFNILSILRKHNHILSLAVLFVLIFGVSALTYLIINLENKKVSFADAVYLAMLLCGIAFILYIYLGLKTFTKMNLVCSIATLISGMLFIVVRAIFFNKANSEKPACIKKYFADVFKGFPFVAILICAIVLICLAYFLTDYKLINLIIEPKTLIVCSVLALPTLLYAIRSLVSSKLTLFDALALSAIFALPIIATLVYVFSFSLLKFMILTIIAFLMIVYFLFRFVFYNREKTKEKTLKTGYVNAVLNKYCVLEIASIGSIIALIATLLIHTDVLHPLYSIRVAMPHINVLPALVLALSALVSLAFFALVALLGASKKDISIIDYSLGCSISFVLAGFVGLIAHPSIIMLIGLTAFLLYSCLILVVRAKSYK